MKIIKTAKSLSLFQKDFSQLTCLVPTMGNLHDGHLSLIELAQKKAEKVVVSIFVNPLQFSPKEDFSSYPRTLSEDLAKLKSKVDFVFLPDTKLLFPEGANNSFAIKAPAYLASPLCGITRPHFFHGVASIVFRLFQILKPRLAIFGEKDFQQYLVIKKMVQEFHLPIKLGLGKIIREKNGLAMSSRNNYLNNTQLQKASLLYHHLKLIKKNLTTNISQASWNSLKKDTISALTKEKIKVEYLEIRDKKNLQLQESNFRNARIFIAATIGKTRLIDNLVIN